VNLYDSQVVPRIVSMVCGSSFFDQWRRRVCAGLSGDVVEIGFGAGANVTYLPSSVRRVVAVEPAGVARRLAEPRISTAATPFTFVDVTAGKMPLADDSFDGALCTFTLCTVEHPDVVLGEIRRVLKPGSTFHFLEHGLSPDARTATWQRRLNGLEQRVAGGCQLTRDPEALIRAAHFEIEWCEKRYAGGPRPWSYFTVGVARKATLT
jgi:ubiquinone/menaquinone biosynthesis C-methylase UbiE